MDRARSDRRRRGEIREEVNGGEGERGRDERRIRGVERFGRGERGGGLGKVIRRGEGRGEKGNVNREKGEKMKEKEETGEVEGGKWGRRKRGKGRRKMEED